MAEKTTPFTTLQRNLWNSCLYLIFISMFRAKTLRLPLLRIAEQQQQHERLICREVKCVVRRCRTIMIVYDHSGACRRLDSRRSSSITLFTVIKVIDGNLFDLINVSDGRVGGFRFAGQNQFQVSLTAVYLIVAMMNMLLKLKSTIFLLFSFISVFCIK